MHAIAETVERARHAPGSYGLVGADGGVLSKYSAGVYSTLDLLGKAGEPIGSAVSVSTAEGRNTVTVASS
jgi:hypothetical protein